MVIVLIEEERYREVWERARREFLYDRQQLPAQCEVEVGGDYYYIRPQRAGPPDRYES